MQVFINTNTDLSKEIYINPKQISLEEYHEELEDIYGEYKEPSEQSDSNQGE